MTFFVLFLVLLIICHLFFELKSICFYAQAHKAIRKEKGSEQQCIFYLREPESGRITELNCCHPYKKRQLVNKSECITCGEGIVNVPGMDYHKAIIFIKGKWEIARMIISIILAIVTFFLISLRNFQYIIKESPQKTQSSAETSLVSHEENEKININKKYLKRKLWRGGNENKN